MTGKITGALREQSDWEQQDENRLGFIKNKPFYDNRKTEEVSITCHVKDLKVVYVDGEYSLLRVSDITMTPEEFEAGFLGNGVPGDEQYVTVPFEGSVWGASGVYYALNDQVIMVTKGASSFLPTGLIFKITTESLRPDMVVNIPYMTFYFPSYTTGELKTLDPKYFPTEVINLDSYQGELDGVSRSISEWILASMSNGKTYGVGMNVDGFFKNIENKENVVFTLTAGTNILHLKEISRAYTTAITGYPKLASVSLQTSFQQPGSVNTVVYVGVTLWGSDSMLMINTHVTPVAMQ